MNIDTSTIRLNRIEKKLDELLVSVPHRRYRTIQDIADEFGMHPKTIKKRIWMQPNWGRSDFPGREKRWLLETYEAWFKVPPAKRKRMWEDMAHRDKQRVTA